MRDSGSSVGKVFGRFSEPAHRVLDLAREEAERFGHRYLGSEHVLLGMIAEGQSRAAGVLRAAGVDLTAARAALARLAERGVVPAPRPSDAELLGALGINLDAVRRDTEQTFGFRAVGEATWRVTRRRSWRGRRVVWTPLCGPPFLAKTCRAAGQRAGPSAGPRRGPARASAARGAGGCAPAGGHHAWLAAAPADHRPRRAARRLPGWAGLLLATLGVDLDRLRDAVAVELGGIRP